MTPKSNYHLAILSNAPISNTEQAKFKGQLLIELSARIEQEDAAEKAKAEAEKAAAENE